MAVIRVIFIVAIGPLLAGIASAQPANFLRKEVFGVAGVGATYDDEGSLGSGINGGGGFGYRLSSRFGLQAEINAFRTKRVFSPPFAPFEASGVHVMGSALLYLTRGRAQLYLIGGAGLLHSALDRDFAGVNRNDSSNGFALGVGGGLRVFVTPRFSLRPELRIFTGGSHAVEPPFSDIRLSLGAGYHW